MVIFINCIVVSSSAMYNKADETYVGCYCFVFSLYILKKHFCIVTHNFMLILNVEASKSI